MLALTHVSVTRATRIPVIIADALVLVLTWMKTFTHKREATRLAMRVPLSTMLLRDGASYSSLSGSSLVDVAYQARGILCD